MFLQWGETQKSPAEPEVYIYGSSYAYRIPYSLACVQRQAVVFLKNAFRFRSATRTCKGCDGNIGPCRQAFSENRRNCVNKWCDRTVALVI